MVDTTRQNNFLLVSEVKGITPSVASEFSTDDAYDAFKALRFGWSDGRPVCVCGSEKVYEFTSRRIFKCAKCGTQFTASNNTIFHARKLPYQTTIRALSISIHDPQNANQLSIQTGINYRTASSLIKNFRFFAGNIVPQTRELQWPFIKRDLRGSPTLGEKLMVSVNTAVPNNIPEQIRADVCQDLIVGILAGDLSEYDLNAQVKTYIRKHYKSCEFNKFRDFSFDQEVPGFDGLRWDEILA